jgi:hypothetical protein
MLLIYMILLDSAAVPVDSHDGLELIEHLGALTICQLLQFRQFLTLLQQRDVLAYRLASLVADCLDTGFDFGSLHSNDV